VTIALGKEKYQTSVKEKATKDVEWHEECELLIPEQGNTAEIVLTALHRNFLGVDEFLGTINIPLSSFDVYERPRNKWYERDVASDCLFHANLSLERELFCRVSLFSNHPHSSAYCR
jgi:hypothetical protein